jgi:Helix-loop-helix DNA-binding domain
MSNMSNDDMQESTASTPASSDASDSQQPRTSNSSKKRSKANKPRLTAVQKNTNHKDAENKRRNAIRERFTELSHMVPGAEGQERSEQVMLAKTTEYLRRMLREQRHLEMMADARGVTLPENDRLKDSDYGGKHWRPIYMEEYREQKAKKAGNGT